MRPIPAANCPDATVSLFSCFFYSPPAATRVLPLGIRHLSRIAPFLQRWRPASKAVFSGRHSWHFLSLRSCPSNASGIRSRQRQALFPEARADECRETPTDVAGPVVCQCLHTTCRVCDLPAAVLLSAGIQHLVGFPAGTIQMGYALSLG